jgi:hypothetical protein
MNASGALMASGAGGILEQAVVLEALEKYRTS